MKVIIFIILTFISSNLSAQNIETYYFDVAQELGHCYEKLTTIEGDSGYYYPLCSDSAVRVFFLEPNYYCVYNENVGWCGSCGCHLDVYRLCDNEYKELGIFSCVSVEMQQPVKNYILISNLQKTSTCWASYKAKYNMKNDWLNLLEIVDYDHKYFGSKSEMHFHMNTCMYVDSLWLFKE